MKFRMSLAAAAAVFGLTLMAPQAQAFVANPGLSLPSAAETVACRTVRERVVRSNGRVVYRTSRNCTPTWRGHHRSQHHGRRHHRGCTMERQRIVRPNGSVVHKQVRRCR